MSKSIRQLARHDQWALVRHFLALANEDRRLRFGATISDYAIRNYVASINFDRDAVFGVLDSHLQLIAVLHLASEHGNAELGVSVLQNHRDQGIGTSLLKRAKKHARNRGRHELLANCLTENRPMMHLARKTGMEITIDAAEAMACLNLMPADVSSQVSETFEQRVAFFNHALKCRLAEARYIAKGLVGRWNRRSPQRPIFLNLSAKP